jgi:hypothetical protein
VYLVRACRSYPGRTANRKPIGIAAEQLFAADRGRCCASAAIANIAAIANAGAIANTRAIANAGAIADSTASAAVNSLRYGDDQYHA